MIIPLDRYRRDARLRDWVSTLGPDDEVRPEDLGWVPTGPNGGSDAWIHEGSGARIGCAAGNPEVVFLEYRGTLRGWAMTIGQLAANIEAGTLPDPVVDFGWTEEQVPPMRGLVVQFQR